MASGSAAARARRLLALVPMLVPGESRSIAELAAAVDARPEDLAVDLVTLSMCGIPPYTPDALVAIYVDEGRVVTWAEHPALGGPVRLSSEESQALVAALEAAGRGPGDPLVDSLMASAGPPDITEASLRARILTRPASVLGAVAAAIEERHAIRIRYLAAGEDAARERVVEPWVLAQNAGAWYLTAFCRDARSERTFRLDRIERVEVTETRFVPPDDVHAYDEDAFVGSADQTAVVLFDPGEESDRMDLPGAEFEMLEDGSTLARVPIVDHRWLARRIVARLGRARVVEPPSLQESVARLANGLLDEEEA